MLVIRDTVSDLDCCLGTSAHRSTQTANSMQSAVRKTRLLAEFENPEFWRPMVHEVWKSNCM